MIDIRSSAADGTVDALIAADAKRKSILLIIKLQRERVVARRVIILLVRLLLHAGHSEYGCGCLA